MTVVAMRTIFDDRAATELTVLAKVEVAGAGAGAGAGAAAGTADVLAAGVAGLDENTPIYG